MMRHVFLLLCSLSFFSGRAQPAQDSLRDYVWVNGYAGSTMGLAAHILFDFKGDSLEIDSVVVDGGLPLLLTNGSICDEKGDLLLYSNGCAIANGQNQVIHGGEHINTGGYSGDWCLSSGFGNKDNTLCIILPTQDSIHLYYLHISIVEGISGTSADQLRIASVKITSDSLDAVFVDVPLITDTLFQGHVVACRHANGRDWWLCVPVLLRNEYKMIYIGPNGREIKTINNIGLVSNDFEDGTGTACFSPDGTLYARYSFDSHIQIMDFDRCTGEFSNDLHIPMPLDSVSTAQGVSFSPNSRFLYATSGLYIFQFDMYATDIAASRRTVATYNGGIGLPPNEPPALFNAPQLAPDGKIYISPAGGRRFFHTIEQPDSMGLACKVIQHKYFLTYPVGRAFPYFPNFRLGPLPGSPCDTIDWTSSTQKHGLPKYPDLSVWNGGLSLSPNPAHGQMAVTFGQAYGKTSVLQLSDAVGRPIRTEAVGADIKEYQIQLDGLPQGLYLLRWTDGAGRLLGVGRFVVY